MNKSQAQKYFKRYLKNACPEEGCDAGVDELCDTSSVWVHLSRMRLLDSQLFQGPV